MGIIVEQRGTGRRGLALVLACMMIMPLTLETPARGATQTYKIALVRVTYPDQQTQLSDAWMLRAAQRVEDHWSKYSYGNMDLQITMLKASTRQSFDYHWDPCTEWRWCMNDSTDPNHMYYLRNPEFYADVLFDTGLRNLDGMDGIHFVHGGACGRAVAQGKLEVSQENLLLAGARRELLGPAPDPQDMQDLVSRAQDGRATTTFKTFGHDYECVNADPDTVAWWGVMAHELGHHIANGLTGFRAGHPASYSDSYGMMDVCYPCHDTAFPLIHPSPGSGASKWFAGWMPASNVASIQRPTSGSTTTAIDLVAVSLPSTGKQAVRVEVLGASPGPRSYYLLQARKRTLADAVEVDYQGIFDEGIHIAYVDETLPEPISIRYRCEFLVPFGCVKNDQDPRASSCATQGRYFNPAVPYCYPHGLWHVGDTYQDPDYGITIRVTSSTATGYRVVIERTAVANPVVDVRMTPWQTPPMNTWETTDIWVDSSCNGYADNPDPAIRARALKYGRSADGTGIGNGDDPCVGHENRVYARLHNRGNVPAHNVSATFKVTDPLGVGIRDPREWKTIGVSSRVSIPPGAYVDVYTTWTPDVELTDRQLRAGAFNFHSCIQVQVEAPFDTQPLNNDGNGEQENIAVFEVSPLDERIADALLPPGGPILPKLADPVGGQMTLAGAGPEPQQSGSIYVHRPVEDDYPDLERYEISIDSHLPAGWRWLVDGWQDSPRANELLPGQTWTIPVTLSPPRGARPGTLERLDIAARRPAVYRNDAIPDPERRFHPDLRPVGGTAIFANLVRPTKLTLGGQGSRVNVTRAIQIVRGGPQSRSAEAQEYVVESKAVINGSLIGAPRGSVVALDYEPDAGPVVTRLVTTDAQGSFTDAFDPPTAGNWTVRAVFQGMVGYAAAVSNELTVTWQKVAPGFEPNCEYRCVMDLRRALIVLPIPKVRPCATRPDFCL